MSLKTYYRILGPKLIARMLGVIVVVWGIYKVSDDWVWLFEGPKSLPPVFYADGSVKYTLIDSIIGREEPDPDNKGRTVYKHYDQHWILRFPDFIECEEENRDGTCDEYQSKIFPPVYSAEANNLWIFLKAPELEFLPKDGDRFGDETVTVIFRANYEDYESYSKTHFRNNEIECRKDVEILPGFFKLRDMTEDERKEVPEEYSSFSNSYCLSQNNPKRNTGTGLIDGSGNRLNFSISGSSRVDRFALYDDDRSIGEGRCLLSADGSPNNCRFNFWLPQERRVSATFKSNYTSEIIQIYRKISTYVDQVSIDIKWREK